MKDIKEYIKLPLENRKTHLKLNDDCLERGGHSTKFQGILAEHLNTSIPSNNRSIHLCHACNNEKCSNPNHLYWGSSKDNVNDLIKSGNFKSGWKNLINKYGEEEAKNIVSLNFSKGRSLGGKASKGRKVSKESIEKAKETRRKNKILNKNILP